VPQRAGIGQRFGVRVTVGRTAGDATASRSVRVRLQRDGERLGADRTIRLERGQRRTINFVDSVDNAGTVRYAATMLGGRGGRTAFVRIGDQPVIGVVGSVAAWPGFHFEAASANTPCDAYLVSAPVRDPALRRSISAAVRAGAGLLALGAPDAPLLPLTENPPEGRAVVVLLDISGSMEPHLASLRQGFFGLCARLDATDRVALVRFRGGVVDASGWRDAADATSLWTTPTARGNTELAPALLAAQKLLLKAEARHRRIYVVSDGEWERGVEVPDVHSAALFVNDSPPEHATRLFPVHARGAGALTTALRKLEEAAPDRWVRAPVVARALDVPGWLRGGLPTGTTFGDFLRLYPNGNDERVALGAGDVPIVAARIEGGRIVQAAAPAAASEAMLRACLADAGRVRVRAWRDGRGLAIEAVGSGGAAFQVGDASVPAHARGADRWGALIAVASVDPVRVACAGATTMVPALENAEEQGLFPNERFARELARVSGGRFGAPDASNQERSVAVYATLLGAALLVLASAWLRRRR
ncbi:MAG: VWA domain-containing protein, partial [Planctomycetota bacterium]